MRLSVELGQQVRRAQGNVPQLGGRHDAIQEAGRDRVVGREDLREDDRAVEVRGREPLPADLDRGPRHRETDGDLVGGDLVRAGRTDSVVAR